MAKRALLEDPRALNDGPFQAQPGWRVELTADRLLGEVRDSAAYEAHWKGLHAKAGDYWMQRGKSAFFRDQALDPTGIDYGYVYLLSLTEGVYKIGRSNNLPSRFKAFSVEFPIDIRLVHAIATDSTAWLERWWHWLFAPKRVKGEWFELDLFDVVFFSERDYDFRQERWREDGEREKIRLLTAAKGGRL